MAKNPSEVTGGPSIEPEPMLPGFAVDHQTVLDVFDDTLEGRANTSVTVNNDVPSAPRHAAESEDDAPNLDSALVAREYDSVVQQELNLVQNHQMQIGRKPRL